MSIQTKIRSAVRFFTVKSRYRFMTLVLIALVALGDFLMLERVRRTFVFYSAADWSIIVEDRMLRRSGDRETDMIRYVEEVLLGPVSPDLVPLFPRETRLRSLLYRDGLVYVDLSDAAVFPPPEQRALASGDKAGLRENFRTLYRGIRRNFPYVRDVRLFVAGNAAFAGEFEGDGAAPEKMD
jgi:hypothetical protein